jgi:hypothetical protein
MMWAAWRKPMETFKERLKRFVDGDAAETFGWMKMTLHNYHVSELGRARENRLYHCVYLMAHAIIQTVSESMFDKKGIEGTRFFLQTFADAESEGTKFSLIASELHHVRNIIAHQTYSSVQHKVEYFADEIEDGWHNADGVLLVNPTRYSIVVEAVFRGSTIFRAFGQLPEKQRLLRKYQFLKQWLGLAKNDSIAKDISALESLDSSDLREKELAIRSDLYHRYGL